jgi:hypothetical protein
MTKDEILRYINAGASKSICIDRRLAPELPGFVRSVVIRDNNVVSVEFEDYGSDEGGIYYCGQYLSLEISLREVEKYLNLSISEWENFSLTENYPVYSVTLPDKASAEDIRHVVSSRTLKLPEGAVFELQEGYWTFANEKTDND